MKKNVYTYSYEMKIRRQNRIKNITVMVLFVYLILSLFLSLVIFPVRVKSVSMEKQVNRITSVFVTPIYNNVKRGDVVYLAPIDEKKLNFPQKVIGSLFKFISFQKYSPYTYSKNMGERETLRRVIGLPNDTIYIKDYIAYVKPQGEEYFLSEFEVSNKNYTINVEEMPAKWNEIFITGNIKEFTLGENEYFVLADNRVEASDSRLYGTIPYEKIKGRALCQYFPFVRTKKL